MVDGHSEASQSSFVPIKLTECHWNISNLPYENRASGLQTKAEQKITSVMQFVGINACYSESLLGYKKS